MTFSWHTIELYKTHFEVKVKEQEISLFHVFFCSNLNKATQSNPFCLHQ